MKIVIVGGSFAGVAAALRTRQKLPQAEIILFEKQQALGFIPGTLNLVLNKRLARLEDGFFMTEAELKAARIDVHLGAEIKRLNTSQQEVHYVDGGGEHSLIYDKLILATGSKQDSSMIKGIETDRLVKFKGLSKGLKSLKLIEESQTFGIVGAGQVGLEMADSLIKQGKNVYLIESMTSILGRYFDQEMLQPLIARMKEQGVVFRLNESVREIIETETGLIINTQTNSIQADAAVFGLNLKPNLSYLGEEFKRHPDQSLIVDDYLRTSVANVFAVGDCIQTSSGLADDLSYVALANNAVRTGVMVVDNLISPKTKFRGSLRTIGTKLFGYYLASSGLTEAESVFYTDEIGVHHLEVATGLLTGGVIQGKLVYDQATGKILGAQLISEDNILEKINTLALAIQQGVTVTELSQKDYFFHPNFTSLMDLTNQLGLVDELQP